MFRCQSVMFYPKIYHSAALENVCVYCWTWGLASGDRGGIRYRWTMRDIRGLKRSFTPAHSKRGEGDFWNVFLYFLWVCDNSALPQTGWLSVCPGPDQRFCALQLLKKIHASVASIVWGDAPHWLLYLRQEFCIKQEAARSSWAQLSILARRRFNYANI